MIVMIIKKKFFQEEVDYEFIDDNKIIYAGAILYPQQIENLKTFGNTIIPYTMYKKLGEQRILEEIKRVTGCTCWIKFNGSHNVRVEIMPEWILETDKVKEKWNLLHWGEEVDSWDMETNNLNYIKKVINDIYSVKKLHEIEKN